MLIVMVYAHVKPEFIDAFKMASIQNASNSVKEPGVARFDVIQQTDDPTRFILIEIYKDADAPAQHRKTTHYLAWREAVEPMMAEARTRAEYSPVFPSAENWK